jgi:histidyl-tRNA synthetase
LAAPAASQPARRHIAFVVWLSEAELEAARGVADRLRADGVPAQIDYGASKVKGQFRSADAARAACCVIVGPDELARGVYSLKHLATGEQREVASDAVVEEVRATFRD